MREQNRKIHSQFIRSIRFIIIHLGKEKEKIRLIQFCFHKISAISPFNKGIVKLL